MLTPAILFLLEATSCHSVGGHCPKLIAQFFEVLNYTLLLSVEATRRDQCSLKYNDNNNNNLYLDGKLKV